MSMVSDFLTRRRYTIPAIFVAIMLVVGVVPAASVDNTHYEAVVQSSQFLGSSTSVVLSSLGEHYNTHSYQEGTFMSGGVGAFYNNVTVLSPNVGAENTQVDTEKSVIMERGRVSTGESMYMNMIGKVNAGGEDEQVVCRDVMFENSFLASSLQLGSVINSNSGFVDNPYMNAEIESVGYGMGSITSGYKTIAGIGNTTSVGSISGAMHKVTFGGEFGTKVTFNWDAISRVPQGISIPDAPNICPLH